MTLHIARASDSPRPVGRWRRLVASAVTVLGPLVALVTFLSVGSSTPDPLPTHWDFSGTFDGSTARAAFVAGFLAVSGLLAVLALLAIWLARPASWLMTSALVFASWIFATALTITLVAAQGATSANAVNLSPYAIVLLVVVPVVAAIVTWRLHPAIHPSRRAHRLSTLSLATDERVVWVGVVHSTPLAAVGVIALVVAAILTVVSLVATVAVGLVGLALIATCSLSVRVDRAGLHTLWGPLGWPRQHVPLADIASVRASEIDPMKWGGWGLRMSRRGTAAVVRRGPGIVVERVDKPPYAVTVDQASAGAEVLEALRARAHPSRRT